MPGQNRKDPFHVNRDVVRDNLTVVRKLRLPRGSQIRARRFYASVTLTGSPPEASLDMPYTGNMYLTVTGGPGPITINNPFITGAAFTPVVISSQPGSGATISATAPGQAVLNSTADGVYVISVGNQTNAYVANNYSQ